jgi:hypothetical protein
MNTWRLSADGVLLGPADTTCQHPNPEAAHAFYGQHCLDCGAGGIPRMDNRGWVWYLPPPDLLEA